MIQVSIANNTKYKTTSSSMELKYCMDQIATTENLREQLVNQIYIITSIQKSINDNSIQNNLDKLLIKYNDSIENINGSIISSEDKVSYFNIEEEISSFEKQSFTMKLATKCQEVETVFDKVATLNAKAISQAKLYMSPKRNDSLSTKNIIDHSQNININNAILANNT